MPDGRTEIIMYKEDSMNLSVIQHQNNFIFRTFVWMFAGLLVTAACAWMTYASNLFWYFLYENTFTILLVAEVVVVLMFSFLFKKLSPTFVGVLFFAYAVLNGVTLSVIFAVYQMSSIVLLFLAGAALFGGFALYGFRCKKDLSHWGPMLFITLLVAVVMSVINIFLFKSSFMELFIDCAVLFLFFGVTVYDMNMIKKFSEAALESDRKLYIYGAMQLYLDFINIFLRLLALFGKKK